MAMIQTEILPQALGLGLGHPMIWVLTILAGVIVGILIGVIGLDRTEVFAVAGLTGVGAAYVMWRRCQRLP